MIVLLLTISDEQKAEIERVFLEKRDLFKFKAASILGSDSLAEDAVSMAFERIMRYMDEGRIDKIKTTTYYYMVVKNTAINLYNQEKRTISIKDTMLSYLNGYKGISDDPSEEIIKKMDAKAKLEEIYKALSEDDQYLYDLRYAMEMKYSEIALLLNQEEDMIKKRGQRLAKKIRRITAEWGDL